MTPAQQKALAARQTNEHYATVLNSPEAKGKHALAFVLLDTDMSAEDIIATLAKAPSGEEPSPAPVTRQTQTDPTLSAFEAPGIRHPWTARDQELYSAGEAFAKWTQGTLAKK
jgi:hypothetical protein